MTKVALEQELNYLREPLKENGFNPVSMDSDEVVSAAIITGRDEDMMNIEEIEVPVPVIDARGRDEQDIIAELQNKLG
ncbi:YkuS family protein [Natranaerobius trueperi]|uniref:YkuS family protein n=1 Tax=Natranaerobius trueperi TaxID=759412 RepID=UPI0013031711|nr:YkuS family protein [Natranaerobius trueperi]